MRTNGLTRWIRLLLKSLGPGIVTGAADDDPSGIATYSVAGAQLGTRLLWTALLTWLGSRYFKFPAKPRPVTIPIRAHMH